MLSLMRSRSFEKVVVVLTTAMMVLSAIAPGLLAFGASDTRSDEAWLLTQLQTDEESLVRAVEAVLATEPASVGEFLEALLGELGEPDAGLARAVLALVVPGLSPDHFLRGAWLSDVRWLAKSERIQSARVLSKHLQSLFTLHRNDSGASLRTAISGITECGNLTRLQIRNLIASLPLGP